MNKTVKGTRSRSEFMTGTIIPVRHAEHDARFRVLEGIMALAFIFGTIALMRLVLATLGDCPQFH
jgi:hypothetical protein